MITLIKNGKFTGTQYNKGVFTEDVAEFHKVQGETWIDREELIPIETDESDELDFELPTQEELNEAERISLKQERDEALKNITYTFSDNAVIQVRPVDVDNIKIAIELGVDQKWVMQDNSIRFTTVTELQEAMTSGITQGQTVWEEYIAKLESL